MNIDSKATLISSKSLKYEGIEWEINMLCRWTLFLAKTDKNRVLYEAAFNPNKPRDCKGYRVTMCAKYKFIAR